MVVEGFRYPIAQCHRPVMATWKRGSATPRLVFRAASAALVHDVTRPQLRCQARWPSSPPLLARHRAIGLEKHPVSQCERPWRFQASGPFITHVLTSSSGPSIRRHDLQVKAADEAHLQLIIVSPHELTGGRAKGQLAYDRQSTSADDHVLLNEGSGKGCASSTYSQAARDSRTDSPSRRSSLLLL